MISVMVRLGVVAMRVAMILTVTLIMRRMVIDSCDRLGCMVAMVVRRIRIMRDGVGPGGHDVFRACFEVADEIGRVVFCERK
jgi:uncharacterized membrane protein